MIQLVKRKKGKQKTRPWKRGGGPVELVPTAKPLPAKPAPKAEAAKLEVAKEPKVVRKGKRDDKSFDGVEGESKASNSSVEEPNKEPNQ